MTSRLRVGILGFGHLGQYLCERFLFDPSASSLVELVFVWNRTPSSLCESSPSVLSPGSLWVLPPSLACPSLASHPAVDLLIEVAHPALLPHMMRERQHSAVMLGSPAALAESDGHAQHHAQDQHSHDQHAHDQHSLDDGLFALLVPAGAMWGAEDIARMDVAGTLKAVTVEMTFHYKALKPAPTSPYAPVIEAFATSPPSEAVVVASGPVKELCPHFPNNVNTMACAALAAPSLGFDGVKGVLRATADGHAHIVKVTVEGPNGFSLTSTRVNPSNPGAVTGSQTFASFYASVLRARAYVGRRDGSIHVV